MLSKMRLTLLFGLLVAMDFFGGKHTLVWHKYGHVTSNESKILKEGEERKKKTKNCLEIQTKVDA